MERNSYFVNSRLIGEIVEVRIFANHLEIWYGGQKLEQLPRLRGRANYRVDYRHIIDWLVRQLGAFASYRYREHLFPTCQFRKVYDLFKKVSLRRCDRRYLEILQLAAKEGEACVDDALRLLQTAAGEQAMLSDSSPVVPNLHKGRINTYLHGLSWRRGNRVGIRTNDDTTKCIYRCEGGFKNPKRTVHRPKTIFLLRHHETDWAVSAGNHPVLILPAVRR